MLSLFLVNLINQLFIVSGDLMTSGDMIVPPNYNKFLPPTLNGTPVDVDIKLAIINIRSIKETDLTYTMDAFYHQTWRDFRLCLPKDNSSLTKIVLRNDWAKKIWVPDTFFKQAISGSISDIVFPSIYFTVQGDGTIFMGARITVTLTCHMRFHKYPHDIQDCDIEIQSLSNTVDTVRLRWSDLSISPNITTIQYDVTKVKLENCTRHYVFGSFSCIKGGIKLTRRIGRFLIKKYIPSFLIVTMSFVGFWIPTNSYPARIVLTVTSLLSLITQEIETTTEVNASYVVALNVWMIICITFVFLALVEFGVAMLVFHKDNKPKENQRINTLSRDHGEEIHWSRMIIQKIVMMNSQVSKNSNNVDIISRKVFPIAYAICIGLYILFVNYS